MKDRKSVSASLKALDTFDIVKDQYFHLVYYKVLYKHKNNKPVEIWAQLVIQVAREK